MIPQDKDESEEKTAVHVVLCFSLYIIILRVLPLVSLTSLSLY